MNASKTKSKKIIGALALGALGVVYGDIGTSPLYAIREIFFGRTTTHYTHNDIVGVISLIFWALTIVVSIKYVILVLSADNEGEGGLFALYSLIKKLNIPKYAILLTSLTFGAGLLLGDGIITPAISVISAVEGISVITSALSQYIVPITMLILSALFLIQKNGTETLGRIFGPVMLVWFFVIALLGIPHIVQNPQILSSLNPWYAYLFITSHPPHILFLVLGAVILVLTGGEAMYADLGHFGRLPIKLSWFGVAYPALILNYLGQGGFLLSGKPVINGNLFYSLVPQVFLIPTVILATLATVIASQALISGAYSLMTQAVSLGLFPFVDVRHTNQKHHGQIFVPLVNMVLCIGSIALVFIFKSSDRMASAYGLAVSGVMLLTSIGMILISRYYWHWPKWLVAVIFIPLIIIDFTFVTANSLKFIEGGYIPLTIAALFMFIATTWQWGRNKVKKVFDYYPVMSVRDLIKLKETDHVMLPRTVIVMTPTSIKSIDDPVPTLKQIFWERYGALPEHLLFLTVKNVVTPHAASRFRVTTLYNDPKKGSITAVSIRFGFMEDIDVEATLEDLAAHKDVNVEPDHRKWLIHVMHERPIAGTLGKFYAFRFAIYQFIANNFPTADVYFGLGKDVPLTIEILPVLVSERKRFRIRVELYSDTS
jgi:KUP system potassium uptake protein